MRTRFSTLTDINTENVKNLKLAWTFSTGLTRGHEAAPLVVNNTMYIVTPWPNMLYALDLTKPGAPVKWAYKPKPSPSSPGRSLLRCGQSRRRLLQREDLLQHTGSAYRRRRCRYRQGSLEDDSSATSIKGESMTMAPIVVKGSGNRRQQRRRVRRPRLAGGLDARDGKIVWRAYATGPDKDVLIGPNFKPFYPPDRGKDLGVKTWPGDAWKIGGGRAGVGFRTIPIWI